MKILKRNSNILLPVAVAMLIAGCGGGSSGSPDSNNSPVNSSTQVNEPVITDSGNPLQETQETVDRDMDGQLDSHEQLCGSDVNDANSMSSDIDADGTPDCVDLVNDNAMSSLDADGDGQSDADELACSSDPQSALSVADDANSNGTPDCVDIVSADPNAADSDGDLQLDVDELACGSDPADFDSRSADANSDNRPDCLRGYPILPVTGQLGEAVDCKGTMPCTWVNQENNIRIKMSYADSRDSSVDENEPAYQYSNLVLVYEISSDIDTDLTFLDSSSFSDEELGVGTFYSQSFLNLDGSTQYSSTVVSMLAATSSRVLTVFSEGAKGLGTIDELTLPFIQNELRFEAVFNNVYHGRVNSPDKDCQNVLPCTWISPDGLTQVTINSTGLTPLAKLKAEMAVITQRSNLTLSLDTMSRARGSDLSSFNGETQRFDQVNELSRSLVNVALETGESRDATIVFKESPNSTLDRLARLGLDLFETIPASPNYEENSAYWNRYRVINTPQLAPVFRNIPITQ